MENVNLILASNILKYRKKNGLTQDVFAKKLGVTYQAVSKWETAKSAPDVSFLPTIADIFGCCIDELFSREVKKEIHYDHCSQFPWPDDSKIRGVVCEGKKILEVSDMTDRTFTFEIIGNARSVSSECNITVNGCVSGGCTAGKNINVSGNIESDITCGGNVSAKSDIVSNDITCGGDIIAPKVKSTKILGNITADSVESERLEGNITCVSIKCSKIEGDVTIKELEK